MKTSRESHRGTPVLLLAAACALAFHPSSSLADLSSGSISYGSGLEASGEWKNSATSLSWTTALNGSLWHYEYKFTVPSLAPVKALSHIIIEVSDAFTSQDVLNYDPGDLAVLLGSYGPDDPGRSNIGMPGVIDNGLKFENFADDEGLAMWSWSFDSPRQPVWGDFFAIDGDKNEHIEDIPFAYNSGFLAPDPIYFEGDGRHIAVPDTAVVPLPTSFLLGMLGLSVAGVKLRKYA